MCTVVILRRPGHRWPLILAANRDEMADRPWRPPGRHWPDRPEVVAGRDELAGGTWLGINDTGLVAGVLNRRRSLGPDALLRSRGELPLEAFDHADAVDAAAALADLDARAYRAFNMVVVDNRDAYWIKGLGPRAGPKVQVDEIPEGVSMLTSGELNDRSSERIARFLPRFESAPAPDPEREDWAAWAALLAVREDGPENGRERAMCVVTDTRFGTLSSSLIALPAADSLGLRPLWRFCDGRPGEAPFVPIDL